jgi:hypothetical protein
MIQSCACSVVAWSSTAVTTGFVRGHRAPVTTNNRRVHRDTHHRCTRMCKRSNLPSVSLQVQSSLLKALTTNLKRLYWRHCEAMMAIEEWRMALRHMDGSRRSEMRTVDRELMTVSIEATDQNQQYCHATDQEVRWSRPGSRIARGRRNCLSALDIAHLIDERSRRRRCKHRPRAPAAMHTVP